jgi:glycosyltransferase involved in cell wall biosynthesis
MPVARKDRGDRRLIFVTQQVDPSSPVLGATVAKLEALARRVDELVVLADGAVDNALPANARVRLFSASTKPGRGLRFGAALASELRRGSRPVAVVAHMCPIYAVLAAPLARPQRVPVLLWFTHWRESRLLHLAERLSTAIITVEPRSFPFTTPKLVPIGHGIDLSGFACVERESREPMHLVALGRTSPAKGLEVIVRGVASVPGVRLQLVGPSLTDEERAHRTRLEALVRDLGVADRVTIGGPIPRSEVPAFLGKADALVNNMRAGATDKIVFEAAATCLPVLASNPALDGLLPPELRFEREDPDSLADRIRALAAADRQAVGRGLRAGVEHDHDVEGWAERVLEVATGGRTG